MSKDLINNINVMGDNKEQSPIVLNSVTASFQTEERFTALQAINEAKRCLHCKNPMCVKGCPIGNNIP